MIQSFFVDTQTGDVRFLLLDTVIDGKHVFTACGQGRIRNGNAEVTTTGQSTLVALADYAQSTTPGGRIHLFEIATIQAAPVRVRKALEAAHQGDAVFFVCRSAQVYDAAVEQLQVVWPDAAAVQ